MHNLIGSTPSAEITPILGGFRLSLHLSVRRLGFPLCCKRRRWVSCCCVRCGVVTPHGTGAQQCPLRDWGCGWTFPDCPQQQQLPPCSVTAASPATAAVAEMGFHKVIKSRITQLLKTQYLTFICGVMMWIRLLLVASKFLTYFSGIHRNACT